MGEGNFVDATKQIAPQLENIGMITDALWVDIDNDNDVDLVMAGEWMTLEVFENDKGKLKKATEKYALTNFTGWWNKLLAMDIDHDGDMDIIAGNHGLNSRFKASEQSPVLLYINDFDQNGSIEHIYAKQIGKEVVPYVLKHDLVAQLPNLKKKYLKYKDYNSKTLKDIFTAEQINSSSVLRANYLASGIFINEGGKFTFRELPVEAQFSPVYSMLMKDINADGYQDLILAGNFFESRPQTGRYDASYGLVLLGSQSGEFIPLTAGQSGLSVKGAVRSMLLLEENPSKLLIGINSDSVRIFNTKVHK
jgi:hypothetical protein